MAIAAQQRGGDQLVGENVLDQEKAALEINRSSGKSRVFVSGLRNPNGLDFEPQTGALCAVVNERDELGSDLVLDY